MTTATMTKPSPKKFHYDLEETARVRSTSTTRVMTNESLPIGKRIRQGDVYIQRIDSLPENLLPAKSLQLVKGTTKGSRHILLNNPSLKMFYSPTAIATQGPYFSTEESVEVTHPEHANFILPAGLYSATYQRDFMREELAAVKD